MPVPQQFISRTETIERAVEVEVEGDDLRLLRSERIVVICRLLWCERRVLLRLLLAALVVSVVISLLLPPTYESTAVLIPSEPPAIGAMAKLGELGNIASLAAGGGDLLGALLQRIGELAQPIGAFLNRGLAPGIEGSTRGVGGAIHIGCRSLGDRSDHFFCRGGENVDGSGPGLSLPFAADIEFASVCGLWLCAGHVGL